MIDVPAFEAKLRAALDRASIPGCAVAIVANDEVVYAGGFGTTSVDEPRAAVTPSTLFRIGSASKPLTGTAILRLTEAGVLDLDRPVSDYAPELRFHDADHGRRVTLRMLLSHTAGIPHDFAPSGWLGPEGLATYVHAKLPAYPFVAPPGTVYAYSNPGINLAGHLAELVTGMSFTALIKALVFEPLEMTTSTFDPAVAATCPLALQHRLRAGRLEVVHEVMDNSAYYPSGFAISNVLELASFARMHVAHGRHRGAQVMEPATIAAMQTPQTSTYAAPGHGYALTWVTSEHRGVREVSHHGDLGTYASLLAMLPSAGLATVILHNRLTSELDLSELAHALFDELLDRPPQVARPASPAVDPDRGSWAGYRGQYLGSWIGLITITSTDRQLWLEWNTKAVALTPLGHDMYAGTCAAGDIVVGFPPRGLGRYLVFNGELCERTEEVVAVDPRARAWDGCLGTFTGPNTITFSAEDGALHVYSEDDGATYRCWALGPTTVVCDRGIVEFHLDEHGTAPTLTVGRHVTFHRIALEEPRHG